MIWGRSGSNFRSVPEQSIKSTLLFFSVHFRGGFGAIERNQNFLFQSCFRATLGQLQSNFGAILEQLIEISICIFQSCFRVVWGQLQSNFSAVEWNQYFFFFILLFFRDVSGQFGGNFRAISVQFNEINIKKNFFIWLFSELFQGSLGATLEQFRSSWMQSRFPFFSELFQGNLRGDLGAVFRWSIVDI